VWTRRETTPERRVHSEAETSHPTVNAWRGERPGAAGSPACCGGQTQRESVVCRHQVCSRMLRQVVTGCPCPPPAARTTRLHQSPTPLERVRHAGRYSDMRLVRIGPTQRVCLGVANRGQQGKGRFHLPCEPTRSTLNIIWSCGLFEGKGVSTSRVSPPGPLSISYGHVGCLKAEAFPPPV
jgi:hypothetical protein